jgi:beta-lactamase regulating signal transducer with metallopeptidase domain
MNSQSFTEALSAAFVWTWKTSAHGAVLIALTLLVQLAFKRALTPRWRYALGLLVVVRLALPFTPSSSLSIFNLAAFRHREGPVRLGPAKIQPPEQKTIFTLQPTPIAPLTQPATKKPLLPILPTTWLAGCIALLALALRQHLNLARQLRGLKPVDEPKIRSALDECKTALHVRRKINVLATDALDTPALFGICRPRLLVPTEMLERLDERELRLVFLHELTHLKRGDILLNWTTILLRSVHWFNPLVWLAFKKLRADQELACDAAVMSLLGEPERRLYGDILIKLAGEFPATPVYPGLVPFITKQKLIKRRITMIARYKPASKTTLALSLIMIGALGIATFTRASDEATTPASTHNQLDNVDESIKKTESQLVRQAWNLPVDVVDAQSASKLDKENLQYMQSEYVDAQKKYMHDSRLYDELNKLSPDDFREALPTATPDTTLNGLLARRSDTGRKLATLRSELGDQHPEVLKAKTAVENLRERMDSRLHDIMKGLEVKVSSLKATMENDQIGFDRTHNQVAETATRYDDYYLDKQTVAAKSGQLKRTRDSYQTDRDRMEIDAKMRSGENIGR